MITRAILDVVLGVPTWLFSHLPTLTLPGFFDGGTGPGTVGGLMGNWAGYVGQWSNWLPLDTIGPGFAIVGASLLAALAVKVIRIVASFLTLGGGM